MQVEGVRLIPRPERGDSPNKELDRASVAIGAAGTGL